MKSGVITWWNPYVKYMYEYPETSTSASGSRAFSGMKPQNCIVNVIPDVRGIRNGWSANGTTCHGSLRTNLDYDALRDRGQERKPWNGTLEILGFKTSGSAWVFISQEFDSGSESRAVPHPWRLRRTRIFAGGTLGTDFSKQALSRITILLRAYLYVFTSKS